MTTSSRDIYAKTAHSIKMPGRRARQLERDQRAASRWANAVGRARPFLNVLMQRGMAKEADRNVERLMRAYNRGVKV